LVGATVTATVIGRRRGAAGRNRRHRRTGRVVPGDGRRGLVVATPRIGPAPVMVLLLDRRGGRRLRVGRTASAGRCHSGDAENGGGTGAEGDHPAGLVHGGHSCERTNAEDTPQRGQRFGRSSLLLFFDESSVFHVDADARVGRSTEAELDAIGPVVVD